jgi:protein-S-isoprenylcysteine O-methyltransferase Ste14
MGDISMSGRSEGHHDRPDLAGEYVHGDMGQIVLGLVFGTVWILDSLWFEKTTFLAAHVPLALRLALAGLVFILSMYLARSGLNTVFGDIRERPVVIREGVFRLVRHPVYLGAMLMYLGFLILIPSLIAVAVWLIIILFYYVISRIEERMLMDMFGKEYASYMEEVPMFIPRP